MQLNGSVTGLDHDSLKTALLNYVKARMPVRGGLAASNLQDMRVPMEVDSVARAKVLPVAKARRAKEI